MFDNKGNWTDEALAICDYIRVALAPALERTLANGMSHSDFCYMVLFETDGLILYDRLTRKKV